MMGPTASLSVRVEGSFDGTPVEFGVPVLFKPVASHQKRGVAEFDHSRQSRVSVVPLCFESLDARAISLVPGAYEVEAILPSGEALHAAVTLESGPNQELVLRAKDRPYDPSSWLHTHIADHAKKRLDPSLEVDNTVSPWWTQYEVRIGTDLVYDDGRRIQANRWTEWLDWIDEHYRDASYHAAIGGYRLLEDSPEFRLQISGGSHNEPLKISLPPDLPPFWPGPIGYRRFYLSISTAIGTRVLSVPSPWSMGEKSRFEIYAFEADGALQSSLTLLDPKWSGLFAYLNAGRVQLASQIIEVASRALYEKNENPLAAAAGGYVLLSTKDVRHEGAWPDWLSNLARRFPHMVDGHILRARWLLASGDENAYQSAQGHVRTAYFGGLPFFTTGVVWLVEALMRFAADSEEFKEMLVAVRGVARNLDMSQTFTSFYFSSPEKRSEPIAEAPTQPSLDDRLFARYRDKGGDSGAHQGQLDFDEYGQPMLDIQKDASKPVPPLQLPRLESDV